MLTAYELDILDKISENLENIVTITQNLQDNLVVTAIAINKLKVECGLGTGTRKQAAPNYQ